MSGIEYRAPEKLYISVAEAGEWTGLGANRIREFVNSATPPPYMKNGKKVLIRTATLPDYLERYQEVR